MRKLIFIPCSNSTRLSVKEHEICKPTKQKKIREEIHSRQETAGRWTSGGHQLSKQRNLEMKWLRMENPMERKPLMTLNPRNTWELVTPGTFERVLRMEMKI